MTLLEKLEDNLFRKEVKKELKERIKNNKLNYDELNYLLKIQRVREDYPKIIAKDKILISIDELDELLENYQRQKRYRRPFNKSREAFDKQLNSRYGL